MYEAIHHELNKLQPMAFIKSKFFERVLPLFETIKMTLTM